MVHSTYGPLLLNSRQIGGRKTNSPVAAGAASVQCRTVIIASIEMYSNGYQGWFMSANATNYMFQAGRGATKSKRNFEFFSQSCCMARKRKSRLAAVARARQAQHFQETSNSNDPEAEITIPIRPPIVLDITSDEEYHWTGGVNHSVDRGLQRGIGG
jgi:hypothetical protein